MKLFLFSLLLGTLAARRLNNEEEEAYIAIVPYEYKIEVDYGEVLLNERDIGQALENFTFTTLNDLSGDNSPVQILEIISADVGKSKFSWGYFSLLKHRDISLIHVSTQKTAFP